MHQQTIFCSKELLAKEHARRKRRKIFMYCKELCKLFIYGIGIVALAATTAVVWVVAIKTILLSTAHAAEYTAGSKLTSGEVIIAEFSALTPDNGTLPGVIRLGSQTVYTNGTWCGLGQANFNGIVFEVVE